MAYGSSAVSSVMIGTSACQSINVISDTTLTCVTSSSTSTTLQTVTLNTKGGTASRANFFGYVPNIITGVGYPLQQVTAANCPTTRVRFYDERDNATYWAQKIGDLCWMQTNLAYAGGGNNAFFDVITTNNLYQGVIGTNTGAGQICYGDNATLGSYAQGCYWIPPNANRTSGSNNPSISTDGGVTNPQYGYLYNWCAAMDRDAGLACQTISAAQPNQNVNGFAGTIINICPRGWRLPTSDEFVALNNAVNGGSTTSPSGLLTNSLFMYSGNFYSASFFETGTVGFYWSSTVATASDARGLYFDSGGVVPANSNNKGSGLAVRCVAD
jgi:uncharacterized protein (TIGR02145 family)